MAKSDDSPKASRPNSGNAPKPKPDVVGRAARDALDKAQQADKNK